MVKILGTFAMGKIGEVEAKVPRDEKNIDTLCEDAIHVLNTKPRKLRVKLMRVRSKRIVIGLSGDKVSDFTEWVDVDADHLFF